jgi:probable rRNA maturation factor
MTPRHPSSVTVRADAAYRKLIDVKQLRAAAQQTLQAGGDLPARDASSSRLTLVITGDEQVHALNRRYRQVDAPTDVLAFATDETAGQDSFVSAPGEPAYLGDVIISYPRAEAQAQAGGHPVSAELQLLVVHGVLHLLGYDHATPAQKRKMWAAQAGILALVGAPVTGPA